MFKLFRHGIDLSKVDNCCDSMTFSSNSTRKDARLGNPSYVGTVLSSAPTLLETLMILAHILMET